MTPNDIPGPIITAESLTPWLLAITPAVEPVREVPPRPATPAPEPLRRAA
jgi:hypothetical protein